MSGVIIHEVGLRDGIQGEEQVIPTEKKIEWVKELMGSGIDIIQLGSFVRPDRVPQMADTDRLFSEVLSGGDKPPNVTLSGLVLNEKGLERGLACGVELFCLGVSASETHSRRNTGMGTTEAVGRVIAMAREARAAGRKVQLSVQSAFGCGYEGPVPRERVLGIVARYLEAGFKTISLADTAGHADPVRVRELFGAVFRLDESVECACHFHNTYGLGLANCFAALETGVKYFESAFGGLGGCPFTKVSGGNVCTEDLVHFFQRLGLRRDIKLDSLIGVAEKVSRFFGRELSGWVYRTGPIPEKESLKGEN